VFIPTNKCWPLQQVKRSKYFIGEEGDYYLIIDADELVKGIIELGDFDVGICSCRRQSDNVRYKRARIIKHVQGIHYNTKHYWIKDRKGRTVALLDRSGKAYQGKELNFTIYHLNHERDFARESAQREYYQIHGTRERSIKEWI